MEIFIKYVIDTTLSNLILLIVIGHIIEPIFDKMFGIKSMKFNMFHRQNHWFIPLSFFTMPMAFVFVKIALDNVKRYDLIRAGLFFAIITVCYYKFGLDYFLSTLLAWVVISMYSDSGVYLKSHLDQDFPKEDTKNA